MKTLTERRKDRYLEFVRQFPLVPIKTEAEHAAAIAFLDQLAIRDEATLDAGEQAYLDALTQFVGDYEAGHHRIDLGKMTPLDALKFLMDENGMRPGDLGRLLGSRSVASQILNGKRGLSQRHIRLLADRFSVEPGVFLKYREPASPGRFPNDQRSGLPQQ